MKLGFIGAGRIGRPMISQLLAAGHQVSVLDQSEAAREAVAALGAVPVDDVAAVAQGAQAVLLCPYSDTQVREIAVDGDLVDHMEPGSVIIIHTTGSPLTATSVAERAQGRDVEVVDAPISGGPHNIEAGAVTLYTGATEVGLERAREVLSAYGDPVIHLGTTGAGQQVKLINNAVFAANIGVVAEAVRLAGELGLDEGAVLRGITNGSGNSMAVGGAAQAGSVARFGQAAGEFIGKDVAVVRKVAAQLGVDLGELNGPHRALGALLPPEHRALLLGDPDA